MTQDEYNVLRQRFLKTSSPDEREILYGKLLNLFEEEGPDTFEPTRHVCFAMNVIKRGDDEGQYLVEFDQKARRFQLIGGKEEEWDRDAEAIAKRETMEELGLPPKTRIDLDPVGDRIVFVDVSPTTGDVTEYGMYVFFTKAIWAAYPRHRLSLKWAELAEALGDSRAGRLLRERGVAEELAVLPETKFEPQ